MVDKARQHKLKEVFAKKNTFSPFDALLFFEGVSYD